MTAAPTPSAALSTHHWDTAAIREFMVAFEQPVRTVPTSDLPDLERLLRVRLVVEEALEFAEAMGCRVYGDAIERADGSIDPKGARIEIDPTKSIDLVESADAISDLIVVAKGSGFSLGIPVDLVTRAVHASNMRKLGPDGKVIRHPETSKVMKPEGWAGPTAAIKAILAHPATSAEVVDPAFPSDRPSVPTVTGDNRA